MEYNNMEYFSSTPLGTTLASQKHPVPKLDFPDTLILNKHSIFNPGSFPEELPESVQETVELVTCPIPVSSQPPKAPNFRLWLPWELSWQEKGEAPSKGGFSNLSLSSSVF